VSNLLTVKKRIGKTCLLLHFVNFPVECFSTMKYFLPQTILNSLLATVINSNLLLLNLLLILRKAAPGNFIVCCKS